MKYVYEAIGTFFLMFTIAMVVIGPGSAPLGFAPIAIGTVLAVMIFAGGHVSGGHYNPAVSLAVFVRGKIAAKDMLIYWVVQILGAVVAVYLALYLKSPAPEVPTVAPDMIKALLVFLDTRTSHRAGVTSLLESPLPGGSHWARTFGALVDYRYGIQGARLSLTELDENHAPTSKVTTQDFTLLGDTLTMNPTKPEGRQLMKRVGQPFPGTHPIVGEWSFKHYSGGMAYMRFGRTGLVQLAVPFESAAGTWASEGAKLTTQLKDRKPVSGPWRIEKGYLHFREDGERDGRYRPFDY